MKNTILKIWNKFIVISLGLVGVTFGSTSCMYGMPAEYGMPHAEYEIKGVVKSKETQKPIKNIRVVRKYTKNPLLGDTIYTDTDGAYKYNFEDFPQSTATHTLLFEDVDGEANEGDFDSQTVQVEFKSSDLEGKDGWYEGKASKIQDVELQEKPTTTE